MFHLGTGLKLEAFHQSHTFLHFYKGVCDQSSPEVTRIWFLYVVYWRLCHNSPGDERQRRRDAAAAAGRISKKPLFFQILCPNSFTTRYIMKHILSRQGIQLCYCLVSKQGNLGKRLSGKFVRGLIFDLSANAKINGNIKS